MSSGYAVSNIALLCDSILSVSLGPLYVDASLSLSIIL